MKVNTGKPEFPLKVYKWVKFTNLRLIKFFNCLFSYFLCNVCSSNACLKCLNRMDMNICLFRYMCM